MGNANQIPKPKCRLTETIPNNRQSIIGNPKGAPNLATTSSTCANLGQFQGLTRQKPIGPKIAETLQMSSFDNIYQKMVPTMERASFAQLHHEPQTLEQQRQVGREVAHELNNILTIIQGYADRMIVKHGDNPALRSELQLISENARRAVSVVKQATPRKIVPSKLA
jgi:signal transduction histidine kinase